MLDGKPLPTWVRGEAIAAQFQFDSGFLLLTHYDYYTGTSHWLYVLGNDGSIKDSASLPEYFGFVQDKKYRGAFNGQFQLLWHS